MDLVSAGGYGEGYSGGGHDSRAGADGQDLHIECSIYVSRVNVRADGE